MILGIGTDIIEVERVKQKVEAGKGFKEMVFSPTEIAYCESQTFKAENYAARFAAKEAFFKALGTGWIGEMAFYEVEILKDDLGKPSLILHGKTKEFAESNGIKKLHVSISHIKTLAQAFVVLEK
jgi:holo-[acyl-carrier protein] synthase